MVVTPCSVKKPNPLIYMEHGLHLSRGHWASQGWLKNTPASAGDAGDASSIPGSGRPPGGGNGNPLQCSWLENLTDRGAWRATAHGVAKTRTQLKRLSTHTEMSLKLKKERHRSYKALLAVWAGAQPGVSPAPGATQRPAPGPDRDEAGRAGPSLSAELSRPAACAGLEEAGRRLRPLSRVCFLVVGRT